MAVTVLNEMKGYSEDIESQVKSELLFLLHNDPESEVREAVIKLLDIGDTKNMPHFLLRTRDSEQKVRRVAYNALQKQKASELTVVQIMSLMKGVVDQCRDISESCTILFKLWIKNQFEKDASKFLKMLEIQGNEDLVERALPKILEGQKPDPKYFRERLNELDDCCALYWRVLAQTLWEASKDEDLEWILPPLSTFGEVIELYSSEPFILKQLLKMLNCFDFSDEQGRKVVLESLVKMLPTNISEENRKLVVRGIFAASIHETDFIVHCLHAISSLTLSLTEKEKAENFSQSTNQSNWLTSVTITEELLSITQQDLQNPGIAGLLHAIILPAIQSANVDIRMRGIACLGLYVLLSKKVDVVREYMQLFLTILNTDTTKIKQMAMQILFDFFNVFGLAIFDSPSESWLEQIEKGTNRMVLDHIIPFKEDHTSSDIFFKQPFLQMLVSLLFSNRISSGERQTIVEGFIKLCLSYRCQSSILVAAIINQYWKEQENSDLRKCIHVVLPYFVHMGTSMKQTLSSAIVPALSFYSIIQKREQKDEQETVDVTNQSKYLIDLLECDSPATKNDIAQVKELQTKEEKPSKPTVYHNDIAVQACSVMRDNPKGACKSLCSLLPFLKLDVSEKEKCEQIKEMLTQLSKLIDEASLYKKLVRFGESFFPEFKPSSLYNTRTQAKEKRSRSKSPKNRKSFRKSKQDEEEEKMLNSQVQEVLGKKREYFGQVDSFNLVSEEHGESPYTPRHKKAKNEPKSVPRKLYSQVLVKYCAKCNLIFKKSFEFCGKCGGKTQVRKKKIANREVSPAEGNSEERDSPAKSSHTKSDKELMPPPKSPAKSKTNPKEAPSGSQKPAGPILLFSGITNSQEKKKLVGFATMLKATVLEKPGYDASVTHVVTPKGSRSLKTLAASLAGSWVVSPEWIEESAKKRSWQNEEDYGSKYSHKPFFNKSAFITPEFLKEKKKSFITRDAFKILVEPLGEGRVSSSEEEAQIVLTSDDKADGQKNLNLLQFLELIQPF